MSEILDFEPLSHNLDSIIGRVRVVEEIAYGQLYNSTDPQDPEALMRGLFYICQGIAKDLGEMKKTINSHLNKPEKEIVSHG